MSVQRRGTYLLLDAYAWNGRHPDVRCLIVSTVAILADCSHSIRSICNVLGHTSASFQIEVTVLPHLQMSRIRPAIPGRALLIAPMTALPEAGTMPNCSLPKQLTCLIGSDDVHSISAPKASSCGLRAAGSFSARFNLSIALSSSLNSLFMTLQSFTLTPKTSFEPFPSKLRDIVAFGFPLL